MKMLCYHGRSIRVLPFFMKPVVQMVNLFDADLSGKLDIDEFHTVVQYVRAYQTIFQTFDAVSTTPLVYVSRNG